MSSVVHRRDRRAPGTARPTAVSVPLVCATQIRLPTIHVAHSRPVESLSMTSVSVLAALIVTGKPGSIVYVSLPAL